MIPVDTEYEVVVILVDETDLVTPETGKAGTAVVEIRKPAGSFATATNTLTEIGTTGFYSLVLDASETDTVGMLAVKVTCAGCAYWAETHTVYETVAATLSTTILNQIADYVLRRDLADAIASSDGDTIQRYCLLNAALHNVGRIQRSTDIIVYQPDGSTEAYTRTPTLAGEATLPIAELT